MQTSRAYMWRNRMRAHDAARDHSFRSVMAILDGSGFDEIPFGTYLQEEWLPAVRIEIELTSFVSCEQHIREYIVPGIGSLPVAQITTEILREFYQELLRTPCKRGGGLLSKNTVIRIHATISWALQRLVDAGRIPWNLAWGARPRVTKSERFAPTIWSPSELAGFLEFVADDDLYPLWNVLAFTGMRRGEAASSGPRFRELRRSLVDTYESPSCYVARPHTQIRPLKSRFTRVNRLGQKGRHGGWLP